MVLGTDRLLQESYHDFGRVLAENGYAVLAPAMVTDFEGRARINRLALLLGTNIWAVEILFIRTFLNEVIQRFPVDESRTGIWGISMGGAYTLYTMPIEPLFSVGIISAWFNRRLLKMVTEDSRYSCFLASPEEHAFLPGLLTSFSDCDLVSLICPRPLLIQTGEHDSISHSSLVGEEFHASHEHYQRLGIADRLEWLLHPGAHEVHLESGLKFLQTWL